MRFLRFLLCAVVMVTGVFAAGAPSAYAVGCVGEGCYNKGPVAMGCTRDQRSIAIDRLTESTHIYYSPACQAVWAISFEAPSPEFPCGYVELERARSNLVVHSRLRQQFCPGEASEWTNMFPKGWYFRGVNNMPPGYPGPGPDLYTPWVTR